MSEEPVEPTSGGDGEDRRSGVDRRAGGDRRQTDRGVWNMPVLRRLVDRRRGEDRRRGGDRRRGPTG
jgi:hypothetical protein